jgi:hypothetical protein
MGSSRLLLGCILATTAITAGQGGPAAPRNGRTVQLTEAAALGQIRAHTVLVNGAWPGPPKPGGPVPVAVPAAAAGKADGDRVDRPRRW